MKLTESNVREINGVKAIYYNSVDEVPVNNDLEEDFEEGEDMDVEYTDADKSAAKNIAADKEISKVDLKEADAEADDEAEVEAEEDATAEETEAEDENKDDEADDSDEDVTTVDDVIKSLKEFDKKLPVEYGQVTIEDKVYDTEVTYTQDDDKVIVGVNCIPVEDDNENIDAENSDDAVAPEAGEDDIPAEDIGDDGVIESLKELTRQKDLLECEVKNLRSAKTVSDAKVAELNESLNKYKAAFTRTSELAAKSRTLSSDVKTLNEQLSQKDAEIKQLKEQMQKAEANNRAKALTESVTQQNAKVKTLTEKLDVMQKEFDSEKTKLNEQLAQYKKGYADRTAIAKSYRDKFNTVLTRYIESKASMLGVRPADITSRLNENYTVDDVDTVCENILNRSINVKRLPIRENATIKINESKANTNVNPNYDPNAGYEIDDTLLELAGLK